MLNDPNPGSKPSSPPLCVVHCGQHAAYALAMIICFISIGAIATRAITAATSALRSTCPRIRGHSYTRSTPSRLVVAHFFSNRYLVLTLQILLATSLFPTVLLFLAGASITLGPVLILRSVCRCGTARKEGRALASAAIAVTITLDAPSYFALIIIPLLLMGRVAHWGWHQYQDTTRLRTIIPRTSIRILRTLSPFLHSLNLLLQPAIVTTRDVLSGIKIIFILLVLVIVHLLSRIHSPFSTCPRIPPSPLVVPAATPVHNPASCRLVTLSIRGLSNRPWSLTIADTCTVSQVLQCLSDKYHVPLDARAMLCLSSRFLPLAGHEKLRALGLDTLSILTVRVRLPGGAPDRNVPNPSGENQWGGSWLKRVPELPKMIQRHLNAGKTQAAIVTALKAELSGSGPSLKTIQNIIREHGLVTSRNPQCGAEEAGAYIIKEIENDQVRRTGYRTIHETLRKEGVHMPRDFVESFLRAHEPDKVEARYVEAGQKLHTAILTSPGPNAEWSCDGHDKLIPEMNIGIWGGIDKFSRRIIGYFAVPTYKTADMTRALYLRLVKQEHGIPFQLSLDKGSETSQAAAIQTVLRLHFDDHDIEVYPAYRGLPSTKNITVERGWRPLFANSLQNILVCWMQGKHGGVYHPEDEVHQQIARWVWGHVVQHELDRYVASWNSHRIRKQKRTKLPSGGTPNDFFSSPWDYGGQNFLVPISESLIDEMLREYTPPDLFHWAEPAVQEHCRRVHAALGSPTLDLAVAWPVVRTIIVALKD